MKKYLILFGILFFSFQAWATDYYVTQSGAGSNDGKSLANAWAVSDFNSSTNWATSEDADKIDPGDTVYFSGTLTSTIYPPDGYGGTSGNYITLDGWQGGTCNPVANHEALSFGSDNGVDKNACPSAAIIDLDSITDSAIYLYGNDYITIQDFQIRDAKYGVIEWDSGGSTGITVRRNYIHDLYNKAIHNVLGTTNNSYWTIGGASGDGNFIYNCSEENRTEGSTSQTVNLSGNNIILSYNEIAFDFVNVKSHNVVEMHQCTDFLVEYNDLSYPSDDAAISIKEDGDGNKRGVVRFNKLHHCAIGISISGSSYINEDLYIYGNFIYNLSDGFSGFRAYKQYDDIYFWSNIVSLVDSRGASVWYQSPDSQGDVYVYNNTIYKSGQDTVEGDSDRAGFYTDSGSANLSLNLVNNIFSHCDASEYRAYYNADVPDARINAWGDNLLYYPSQSITIYWKGDNYTLSQFQAATSWGDGTTEEDPAFTDPDGGDNTDGTADDNFTLTQDSPAIGTATDLGGTNEWSVTVQGVTYYMGPALGLDPNSDWTTTPPTASVLSRDVYGWSKGAYVFLGQQPAAIEGLVLE